MNRGHTWNVDMAFRQHVSTMVDGVVKRANIMGCKIERDQVCCSRLSIQILAECALLCAGNGEPPKPGAGERYTGLYSYEAHLCRDRPDEPDEDDRNISSLVLSVASFLSSHRVLPACHCSMLLTHILYIALITWNSTVLYGSSLSLSANSVIMHHALSYGMYAVKILLTPERASRLPWT